MQPMILSAVAGLVLAAPLAIARPQAPAKPAGGEEPREFVPAPQRTTDRVTLDDLPRPELEPGDRAPAPAIGTVLKGEPVERFEPGQVYVMEFWATWCRPCIDGFPHLTELQEEHGDDVRIIGVNVWDQQGDESYEQRIDRIRGWVSSREDMGYTVVADTSDKRSETEWMRAAGQNGIPAAFIIDREGRIAWIGHPMAMDEPLRQLVEGELTTEELVRLSEQDRLAQAWAEAIFGAMQEGRWDAAYATAHEKIETVFKNQPALLGQIAWVVLTHPALEGNRDPLFAKAAAKQAVEATEDPDAKADLLDTLAFAHWQLGERAEAIEASRRALELAQDPELKAMLQEKLNEYQAQVAN